MAHQMHRIVAEGFAAAVSGWAAIGASLATVGAFFVALPQLVRRRRKRNTRPEPPTPPYTKQKWEIYAHELEQYLKDTQEGS